MLNLYIFITVKKSFAAVNLNGPFCVSRLYTRVFFYFILFIYFFLLQKMKLSFFFRRCRLYRANSVDTYYNIFNISILLYFSKEQITKLWLTTWTNDICDLSHRLKFIIGLKDLKKTYIKNEYRIFDIFQNESLSNLGILQKIFTRSNPFKK